MAQVFVEATIYAMDEENELMAGNGSVAPDHVFQGGWCAELSWDADGWHVEHHV